jgi:hypothetical protein
MVELENFVETVKDFGLLTAAEKIVYFAYFISEVNGKKEFNSKEINDCFESLQYKPYSNISTFLAKNSKGKSHIFLRSASGYSLERSQKEALQKTLGKIKIKQPTNNLFPLEIFAETRGYLKIVSSQAATCYDYGLFDACSVMVRKLLETLIIETFERFGVESVIKNGQGFYFYLSDLINELVNNSALFRLGRNTIQSLPKLKKLGDLSAHNRRYTAKKSDIDNVKDELRICLEELI